jgi:hypothetical protein
VNELFRTKTPAAACVLETNTFHDSAAVPDALPPFTVALMLLFCSRISRTAPFAHRTPVMMAVLQNVPFKTRELAPAVPV